MYTMKEVCTQTGMPYETLKFYCNQGLIPGVKRDSNNHRIFNDQDIAWINSLGCLKRCSMSIQEMKEYVELCIEGESSIPKRKEILKQKRNHLETAMADLQKSINFIDWKQQFYDDVLSGKTKYYSNLTSTKTQN